MTRTITTIVAATLVAFALVSCAGEKAVPVLEIGDDPDVVTHDGVGDIRFGDSRAQLERDHGLTRGPGDCAPRLPDHPTVSPVFHDDRLVLLWADLPLRTPEGIGVGTPVSTLDEIHPEAERLPAPPRTLRFDGLLVDNGERATLFLHDGDSVQKVIVGSTEHARLLFDQGFGTC